MSCALTEGYLLIWIKSVLSGLFDITVNSADQDKAASRTSLP